ncbi:MAG: alpha/beta hydrolase [Flavobacterium sp.]|nr:MAG: alpha/beta hydrolase [Flavobacterium sp.]
MMKKYIVLVFALFTVQLASQAQQIDTLSITLENVKYAYPVQFLNLVTEGQDIRMAYMDVKPTTKNNGKTVMLFHGKNFGGYYWTEVIKSLSADGYRVIVPDQIGFGKSSKPFIHYSFHQLATWNKKLLDTLGVQKASILGHSMGGMLATRFALLYPEKTEKLLLENPIGLEDYKTFVPYVSTEQQYKTELKATAESIQKYYQSVRMYLPSSTMNVLKNYPDNLNWYSLAEFWNNAAWGKAPADPYRLTVGLHHNKGADNAFYFHFSADKYRIKYKEDGKTPEKYIPTDLRDNRDSSFKIPVDTWITVEYYLQEGNWKATAQRPAGHFYMTVQPDGGKKQVLFNERVATIHPDQTIDPDGVTSIHPMKFYTSKLVGDFMKQNKTPLEILWDDLVMYTNKIPNDPALKEALAKP